MNVRDLKVEVKQGNIYLLKLIFIALKLCKATRNLFRRRVGHTRI